ncbi:hypothetical protein BDV97DRAFT_349499 [Delphinella strobiligena]|nr:hypothetical protein BDV97DRAFT_349499 [Delphinella strobiligena]
METRQTTTTRATRSQTRSVSADPASQAITRATRSRSRQLEIGIDASDLNVPKPNARRNARKPATAPLDPVLEDLETDHIEDVIKSAEEALDDDVSPEGQDLVTRLVSPSVAPSLAPSALTNMTTFSRGELESLDSELIIETMEELDINADRLLKVLVPAEATAEDIQKKLDELYTSDSRLTKLLQKRAKILFETKGDTFGSQKWIEPDFVLRRLFNVDSVRELPESHWRLDAIFYEANLATLVSELCQMTADERDFDVLTSLDGNFPTPFISGTGVGASTLIDETFNLALELRTQLAIKYMADQAPQNYEEATQYICSLFINPDAEDPSHEIFNIETDPRGWEGLAGPRGNISQILVQRVEKLRRPFNEGKEPLTALREVEMAFPWYRFQTELLHWAQMRTQEINDEIAHQGGSPAVIDALKRELDRRLHNPDALKEDSRKGSPDPLAGEPTLDREVHEQDQLIEEQQRPAGTASRSNVTSSDAMGKKYYTADLMSKMRRVRNQSASTQPVSAVRSLSPSRHTPIDAVEEEYHDIDDVVPDKPMEPESPMKKLLNLTLERDSRENKENQSRTLPRRTLFDSQEDGERVEFDDGFASQEQGAARTQTNVVQFRQPKSMQTSDHEVVSSPKRRREPDIEDPSEDEGFEDDDRAPPPPKRTRIEYARPSNRHRVSVESPQPSRHQGSSMVGRSHGLTPREKSTTQLQDTASIRPRKNPGQLLDYKAPRLASADDDAVPTLTPAEQYRLVSHQAKNKRRVNTIVKPPRQRQRKPWEDQEVEQLIALIGEYGCSWSLLLKMDHENILADRTQGDLKDKARNIKCDYLIAGWELPPNFERVALDRKAIWRCEKNGVTVDQPPQRGRRRVHIVNNGDEDIEDAGEDEV